MTHLTTSQVRSDLSDVLNRVAFGGEHIILERRGKSVAAIIPIEELELLEQALQAAEDKADLAEIKKARKEIAREGTVPWEKVKKDLGL